MALPQVKVEIAPTAGVLDSLSSITWQNVSSYWRGDLKVIRGAQHELSRFQAGEVQSLRFKNTDGRFDPFIAGGPYGTVEELWRIRLSWIWASTAYPFFTGYIEDWKPDDSAPGSDAWVDVPCFDAFKVFNLFQTSASPYARSVLALNPGLYWRLGDSVGNTVADESPNGRTGAISGSVALGEQSLLTNDPDTAVYLGPTGKIAVSDPTVFDFERTDTWSIAFLMTRLTDDVQTIATKRQTDGTKGWTVTFDQFLHAELFVASGATGAKVRTRRTILPGYAYHVVITYSGTGTAAGFTVYIDGIPSATHTVLDTLGANSIKNNGTFQVGRQFNTVGIKLDEVAVFPGVVLTDAQAKSLSDTAHSPWAYQRSSERISAVLDMIGWPAGDRSIDVGATTLAPVSGPIGDVLDHMMTVAETEDGSFFVGRDGVVKFRNRYAGQGASAITFGDAPGEIQYKSLDRQTDEANRWTEVHSTRQDGAMQVQVDAASTGTKGTRVLVRDGLWSDDNQVNATALRLLNRYSPAQKRFPALAPSELSELWPLLLPLDLRSDRVTVKKRPVGGGLITKDNWIEGFEWSASSRGRVGCTLKLMPADPTVSRFIVGTSNLGSAAVLGS